jgi:DHA1 family inner membrane transport protein
MLKGRLFFGLPSMPLAVFALSLAAFCIGTTEFIISGILFGVSADLGVSVPMAGLLVTGYAAGVAVGGPVLALLTARVPIKPATIGVIAVFAIGQLLCAFAPNYELLLAARLISACGHGVFFGVATVAVSQLVPVERRGAALSLMVGGITVANILGLPAGTAIGNAFGWRMTFWSVAALGVLSLAAIALLVPRDGAHEGSGGSLLAEIKVLGREPVYTSLAIIVSQTIGQFALFTYIAPVLTGASHVPADSVPWLLLVFGVGSTIGVLVGGRLADWKLLASLTGILSVQLLIYLLMVVFVGSPWIMAALVLAWGGTAFAFGAPVQTRILSNTQDAPMLAASLIPSAFNVAIAAGAWLGGALIDAGQPYKVLPWVGVIGTAVAVAIAVASWAKARQA